MGFLEKTLSLDRRWIYLLVGLGVLIPTLAPIGFKVIVSPPVQAVYDRIETLKSGDAIFMVFDYGPDVSPELSPMARSILRQCFRKNIKVVGLSLMPMGGPEMADTCLHSIAKEFDKTYGVDYVNLGYKSGAEATMLQMKENLLPVFPRDYSGNVTADLPLMREVRNYDDVEMIVDLPATILGEWWITLVNARFSEPVAIGTTAVSAPKYYAYLNSKQILGLIAGMKGASEYEFLLNTQESATQGMDSQTVVHLIIMGFIIVGNLAFILQKKKPKTH